MSSILTILGICDDGAPGYFKPGSKNSENRLRDVLNFSKSLGVIGFSLIMGVSNLANGAIFGNWGTSSDGPLPVEQAYTFSSVETAPGVYQLIWKIEPGYYLYRDKIKVKNSDAIEVLSIEYAEAEPKEDPLFGNVLVYYNQASVDLRLTSRRDSAVDDQLSIEYQGCWDGGICYPPVTKALAVNQVPVASDFDQQDTLSQLNASSEPLVSEPVKADLAFKPSALPTPSAALIPSTAQTPSISSLINGAGGLSLTDQRQFMSALGSGDLALVLVLFFVAGLALSLTPCVFPMFPILAGIIAGQQDSTPRKAFWMSVIYVLAMAITYTLAGVFAGLFGDNLQVAFQTPGVIISFSLLFVVLSLSMFGFYQLQIPSKLQDQLNRLSRSQQGGEVAGVAIMGFLSALIVGPCVAAPLAGALIFISQTGEPVLGGMALFVLSIGMGLPLILVGTSAGKYLPRAGAWMNSIKSGFGVVMLLMAVWMIDRIVPTASTMVLTGVILVISAIYLKAFDSLPADAKGVQRFAKGTGILMLIYGSSLLVGAAAGNQSMVYPLKGLAAGSGQTVTTNLPFTTVTSYQQMEPLLLEAKQNNKPVMLDFYADWCVACDELEFFTFADARVQQQFAKFKLIKVDVTANDQASKDLYRRYEILGPPALVFYDRKGGEQLGKKIVGVPSPGELSEHLKMI